jgi:hypothetical protein
MGMGVAVALIVDRQVRDHATGDKLVPAVFPHQLHVSFLWDFARDRDDDPSCDLGVPLLF